MFNIDRQPQFKTPVTVRIPDGEGFIEETFSAEFIALDVDEVNSFDESTASGLQKLLEAAIVSLSDIVGANGDPVPYSVQLRDRVLNKPWARQALFMAYVNGIGKGAAGN